MLDHKGAIRFNDKDTGAPLRVAPDAQIVVPGPDQMVTPVVLAIYSCFNAIRGLLLAALIER